MAIEKVNKVPDNTLTGSTAGTAQKQTGNAPVPVGENNSKTDDLTKLTKSEEFQNLSYKEKLAKLKELFPDMEEAVLKTLLNDITTPIPAQTNETETQEEPKTEEEKLINKYAAQNELDQIDDVIAYIKTKQQEDLTAEEKQILEYYDNTSKSDIKTIDELVLTNSQKCDRQVLSHYYDSYGKNQVTTADKLKFLEEKVQSGQATEAEKKELDRMMKDLESFGGDKKCEAEYLNQQIKDPTQDLSYIINKDYNGDVKKWAEDKGIDTKDINTLKKLLNETNDYDTQMALAKLYGIEDRTTVLNMMGTAKSMYTISRIENKEKQAEARGYAVNMDSEEARNAHRKRGAQEVKNNGPEYGEIFTSTAITGKYGAENAQKLPIAFNEAGVDKEVQSQIGTAIANNSDIDVTLRQSYIDSTIQNAASDSDKLYYGKEFSQNVKDADVLETVGAAAKYIQDSTVKSEYASYVETAAKNYSSEVQTKIITAMKTGTTSAAAATNTTTATTTAASAAATASTASVQAQTYVSTPTVSNTTSSYSPTDASTSQNTSSSPAAAPTTTGTSASSAASAPAAASTQAASSSGHTDETAHLEEIRDEAARNAQETAENIKQSIAEHEAQEEIRKTIDEAVEQLVLDGNITVSEKEKIKQQLLNAGSISGIYEIISKLGAGELFLDRIANGSSFVVNSFINSINDKSIIKDLYLRCSIDTVKKELLSKLSEDDIISLIKAGKISNLNDVDYKIIHAFILKNMSSLHYQDLTDYLQYLPGDIREKLEAQFKELNGIEDLKKNETAQVNKNVSQQNQPPENNSAKTENKPSSETKNIKTKTTFSKDDGSTKILADGTKIKRATFAGVSDVIDDNTFEVVEDITQKAMNDTVLTPGSDAWREKYGRYEYQAPPAFTMAAFEEDDYAEEYLSSYPPQSIPNWKYSNKTKKINFKG